MRTTVFISLVSLLAACAPTVSEADLRPFRLAGNDPCHSVDSFRGFVLKNAEGYELETLLRWHPPQPPLVGDRPVIERLAKRYVTLCGLHQTVELTRALISFPTISSQESPATGPSFAAMATFLDDWALRAGLRFNVVGNHDAWEIILGEGPRNVAFVMHADVVPAGSGSHHDGEVAELPAGWEHSPFHGTVGEGRLYGRGAEDNKGAIAATLVALRTLKRFGIQPHGELAAVLGTGEESDWSGMVRYAKIGIKARHTISVDASFPLVVAESGFVEWQLGVKMNPIGPMNSLEAGDQPLVVDASGGQFLTQVPGQAQMRLVPPAGEPLHEFGQRVEAAVQIESNARSHARSKQGFILGHAVDSERGEVVVAVEGQALHSSQADQGHNALWPLAGVAARLGVAPNAFGQLLQLIGSKLDGDHWGEKLGIAYQHPLMGRLLVAPTLLRAKDGVVTLSINMRRPTGRSNEAFSATLDQALAAIQRDVSPNIHESKERYLGNPFVSDTEGNLATTLLSIYREHTGQKAAAPKSIRGGTYAKLFPGAVSFGPSFPGRVYRGHTPNEYIRLDDLLDTTSMLLEAALRLDREVRPSSL